MENNSLRRIVLIVMVLLTFGVMLWYFTDIFVYIFIALVLAIIGSPLVRLLQKIHTPGGPGRRRDVSLLMGKRKKGYVQQLRKNHTL